MSNPDATGGPSEYSQGFDAGFKEGRKKYPASSNTDDLEAKAREWYKNTIPEDEPLIGEIKLLAAFARSLAQPPSSEVVEAGNAMRYQLTRGYTDPDGPCASAVRAWDAAIGAHPKDPAPADRIKRCCHCKEAMVNQFDPPPYCDQCEKIIPAFT